MTKRPHIAAPTARGLLAPARVTREAIPDFHPMVLYVPRHGQGYQAILADGADLAAMVANTVSAMRARLGPAEWIAVTTDAYVKHFATPDDVPTRRLADAFVEGDPEVQEQMIVILRHRYNGAEMAAQTYRYLPSEGWEWGPEEDIEADGPVVTVLDYYM